MVACAAVGTGVLWWQWHKTQSPYVLGQRAQAVDNSRAAASLYACAIRRDTPESRDALAKLLALPTDVVLGEAIALLDLPDGRFVGAEDRQTLWKAICRSDAALGNQLVYEPASGIDIRRAQRAKAEAWLIHREIDARETGPDRTGR